MRQLNKEKAKQVLTKEDIKKGFNSKNIDAFDSMLNDDLYGFRVKKYFYEAGKLSKKGFLFNNDIYILPLGKKNSKGEILIDDAVLEIFDRYLLAKDFALKGDVMTAFLVDMSDTLYTVIKEQMKHKGTEKEMKETEYVMVFNTAYLEVTAALVDHDVNMYLSENPDLQELVAQHNMDLTKKK
jgi:hypothetical protein